MNSILMNHSDLIQLLIAALLAYGIYTVRRYLVYIDGLGHRIDKIVRILVVMVTEHRRNHPDSTAFDAVDVFEMEEGKAK